MRCDWMAVYRWRREVARLGPLPESAALPHLLALRRETGAVAPRTSPAPPPDRAKKVELCRRYLTVAGVELPAGAAEELQQFAARMAGRVWSVGLLETYKRELEQIAGADTQALERAEREAVELRELRRHSRKLVRYAALLDALTGSTRQTDGGKT